MLCLVQVINASTLTTQAVSYLQQVARENDEEYYDAVKKAATNYFSLPRSQVQESILGATIQEHADASEPIIKVNVLRCERWFNVNLSVYVHRSLLFSDHCGMFPLFTAAPYV